MKNEKKNVSPPNQKTETCNMTKQVKRILKRHKMAT